jgi:peptidoglycan/LPS O-acetylase OafA/YrhL
MSHHTEHIPALDGVRVIALALVLAFHARTPVFSAGGYLGVDMFFVLSGYLITKILSDRTHTKKGIDLREFYLKRLRRLYPALLTFLSAYLLILHPFDINYKQDRHLTDSILAALYLTDYTNLAGIKIKYLQHTWSLSVEAKYYIILPIIIASLHKTPKNRRIFYLASLFIAATLWRLHVISTAEDPWTVYNRFDTHASGLIMGSLIAVMNIRIATSWGIVGLAGIFFSVTLFEYRNIDAARIGFTITELSTSLVILAEPKYLGANLVTWLGKMSYGVYLWHYPIMRWMREQEYSHLEILFIAGIISLSAAATSYYLIERHFLKPGAPESRASPQVHRSKPSSRRGRAP